MKSTALTCALLALTRFVFAQNDTTAPFNVTVPATCSMQGFTAGHDQVIYRTPYTYDQVISIIGSYKNLTWSGNPDNTVTLNGTDNTVGTARAYTLMGLHLVETILTYDKPPGGPYYEVHNTALLKVPSANLSFYIPYDATNVTSICGGKASEFNFTANFCSTNTMAAQQLLHMAHMTDAVTVGKFLGGMNFTSCADLMAMSSSTSGAVATQMANVLTFVGGLVVAVATVLVL